jgi:hypothetical protein
LERAMSFERAKRSSQRCAVCVCARAWRTWLGGGGKGHSSSLRCAIDLRLRRASKENGRGIVTRANEWSESECERPSAGRAPRSCVLHSQPGPCRGLRRGCGCRGCKSAIGQSECRTGVYRPRLAPSSERNESAESGRSPSADAEPRARSVHAPPARASRAYSLAAYASTSSSSSSSRSALLGLCRGAECDRPESAPAPMWLCLLANACVCAAAEGWAE